MYSNVLNVLRQQYPEIIESLDGIYLNDISIKIFISDKVDLTKDGSCNGTEIHGIGLFTSIKVEDLRDTNIFCFEKFVNKEIEYIIISKQELLSRLSDTNFNQEGKIQLRFWLVPWKNSTYKLVETYGIGGEFEFIGLWLDEKKNYILFRHNWNII